MALIVFLLGLVLLAAGGSALFASIDLVPTEIGMLYAGCGAVAASSAFIVLSIAALIRKLDRLAKPGAEQRREPLPEAPALDVAPGPEPRAREAENRADPPYAEDEIEAPIDANRAGRFPTLHEVEEAIAHPEAPPTLVGRYSAGGASYMIFSDGTIEAETAQGAFRFSSLNEFKAFMAGRPG